MHLSQITPLPIGERVETYLESLTVLLPQSVEERHRHTLKSSSSRPVHSALDLDPYSCPSGLSVKHPMPMSHLETNTCSPSTCWGKEEHTESAHVPLIIGTVVSPDPETSVSADSPASCVPTDGSGNMSSAQPDW